MIAPDAQFTHRNWNFQYFQCFIYRVSIFFNVFSMFFQCFSFTLSVFLNVSVTTFDNFRCFISSFHVFQCFRYHFRCFSTLHFQFPCFSMLPSPISMFFKDLGAPLTFRTSKTSFVSSNSICSSKGIPLTFHVQLRS